MFPYCHLAFPAGTAFPFGRIPACFQVLPASSKSGRTPLELEALLQSALPFQFTFAKLAPETTSRSHQFTHTKAAPY